MPELVRDQFRQARRAQHSHIDEDITLAVDGADVLIRGRLNRNAQTGESIEEGGAVGASRPGLPSRRSAATVVQCSPTTASPS